MYSKAAFLIFQLWILATVLPAQASLEHRVDHRDIDSLFYNTEQFSLYLQESDGNQLVYDGTQILPATNFAAQPRGYRPLYFDANAASLDGEPIVIPEDVLAAIVTKKGKVYLSSEQGLYLLKDGYPVQFYHPLAPTVGRVDKIFYYYPFLIFRNNFDQLIYWNQETDLVDMLQVNGLRVEELKDLVADNQGSIWFADDKGIYSWTHSAAAEETPPALNLEYFKRNGTIDEAALENLKEGDNLEIGLKAKHLVHADRIKYYYTLQKKNRQYEYVHLDQLDEIGDKNSKVFANLKTGSYILNIKSSINGKFFRYLAPIKFDVVEGGIPLWVLLIAGAFLFLSALLIWSRLRSKNFIDQISTQRDKLKLENKALKYQQKALQLQMNPHFIFNALNAIQGLIAKGDSKNARQQLNAFSQLMRSVLDQSRADEITIKDELKYLKNYLTLEQMCRDHSFNFEIEVSEELDPESKTMAMIIQPFVENAVIHAFKELKKTDPERQAEIKIKLMPEEDKLCAIVEDNGMGFVQKKMTDGHQSHALNIVQDRLQQALGKGKETYKIDSVVNQGTVVTIYLPLS